MNISATSGQTESADASPKPGSSFRVAVTRLSPTQIQVNLPLGVAREVVWRAFVEFGMVNTLIDVEANAVAAQTPVARRYKGPRHWAFFRDEPDRVVITFECKSGVRKVRFHARTLRDSKNLVKVAETALRSFKYEDKSVKESPYAKQSSLAPIASPTGPVGTPQIGRPEYGRILPIKFGKMILAMSPMGLMNPAPAVVFTAAAWITLRDYGPNDPGDRHLVRLGLIIGIVEVVLWAVALIWLHRFGYI